MLQETHAIGFKLPLLRTLARRVGWPVVAVPAARAGQLELLDCADSNISQWSGGGGHCLACGVAASHGLPHGL